MKAQQTPSQCPTLRHIRREHSSLNIRTGECSPVEKVTWSTEACATPLFGKDRVAGICSSCAKGWQAPGSRFASDCTLEQAQAEYNVRFSFDGQTYTLASMLEANAHDLDTCEWLRTAKVGDIGDTGCKRIA